MAYDIQAIEINEEYVWTTLWMNNLDSREKAGFHVFVMSYPQFGHVTIHSLITQSKTKA